MSEPRPFSRNFAVQDDRGSAVGQSSEVWRGAMDDGLGELKSSARGRAGTGWSLEAARKRLAERPIPIPTRSGGTVAADVGAVVKRFEHAPPLPPQGVSVTFCEECGRKFERQRRSARYCTTACRMKAYRGRKKMRVD